MQVIWGIDMPRFPMYRRDGETAPLRVVLKQSLGGKWRSQVQLGNEGKKFGAGEDFTEKKSPPG